MIASVTFVLLAFAGPAWASHSADSLDHIRSHGQSQQVWAIPSSFLPHAFPTAPLVAGQWQFSVAPGLFKYRFAEDRGGTGGGGGSSSKNRNISMDGYGVAVSVVYPFTEHLGLGFIGTHATGDGESLMAEQLDASGAVIGDLGSTGDSLSATVGAAFAVFDPFGDPDGFRLPLLAGLSYQNISLDKKLETTISSQLLRVETKTEFSTVGYLAGIAPSFKAFRKFRVTPFFMYLTPGKDAERVTTDTNVTTGASRVTTEKTNVGVEAFGMALTYEPWNLTWLWNISAATDDTKTYSLKWSKKWGGS